MAAHSSFNTNSIHAQPTTACDYISFDFSLEAFWDCYYFTLTLGRIQMQIASESCSVLNLGAKALLSTIWFRGCFGKTKDVTWEWSRRVWKRGEIAQTEKKRPRQREEAIKKGGERWVERQRTRSGRAQTKQKNPLDRQYYTHLNWQYFVNSCLHATDTIIKYISHNPL